MFEGEGAKISPRRRRGYRKSPPWGDDPLKYYKENFEGTVRGKLQFADFGLYKALKNAKLLDQVPLKNELPERLKDVDLLEYCKDHYPEATRSTIYKLDRELRNALNRAKLLDQLPRIKPKKPIPWGNDPFGYYQKHYAGKTRRHLVIVDFELFKALKKTGALDTIPR
jgi:hypothetical protein